MRRGTTLIELVVAMVVLVVFLYMATSLSGTVLTRTAAQREVLAIQGAFRSACETIVQDGRRASWPNNVPAASVVNLPYTGTAESNPYIARPANGSLDGELALTVPVNGIMHLYRYYLASTPSGARYVARSDYLMSNASGIPNPYDWAASANGLTLQATDPITPSLNQLTHVYFVRRGGTVTMVFTATFVAGRVRQATYTSNLFVRNYLDAGT
jgi:type II secretory pathway pseudopilin PulG